MALRKKTELNNGTNVEYHNIASIQILPYSTVYGKYIDEATPEDIEQDIAESKRRYEYTTENGYEMIVTYKSYVSEEIRRKDPSLYITCCTRSKRIKYDDFNSNNLFAQAYDFLKTVEDLNNAEDC